MFTIFSENQQLNHSIKIFFSSIYADSTLCEEVSAPKHGIPEYAVIKGPIQKMILIYSMYENLQNIECAQRTAALYFDILLVGYQRITVSTKKSG